MIQRKPTLLLGVAFTVSAFCMGVFYLLMHLSGMFSIVFWIILFFVIAIISYFILDYIYNKSATSQLKEVYQNLSLLKNIKEKQFKSTDSRLLKEEINRILKEWSGESRQEIDQLKQVELYRKEFLGNVSHELKTPIFSVQGYVHTLIDGGIEDADINMLYLQKASKGIDRLISMVDDLESISKLEAGELPVEPRTFDISELAKEVIESLEVFTREKNISLKLNEDLEKQFYVYADKDLIRQVLVNLIYNSVKYGKKDGVTTISFTDSGDKIITEIADNGIGIEKHHLPRLFERFYRVDKSRSREQGGTGLGLAIVKHIMEAHQQSIQVESELNKGTTFSFSLKKSK
jgi:two-component system, OmpR family, phosphate regulon sensor histidine kinase PhoR